MQKLFISYLISFVFIGSAVAQQYEEEIAHFQQELNEEFRNPEESPLPKKDLKKFKKHNFFPIDSTYKVLAKFVKTHNALPFKMQTTTDRLPTYEKYGEVIFEIEGQILTLSIYQSHQLRRTLKYKDHLFLPFTDLTNGKETYGGGRYLDLTIPSGDTIVIDFNKAYNPYCAYNPSYSCPIPPEENDLNIRIEAGVKHSKL
ncbi:DUF1684 domain-containing protein [Rapidithrix thailandica]|uniref:DUF1684 domain-containing protein n=1 Tax=Rapidithrix thailandica TaxID=413964 RepID=A0AAW9SBL0_9BACT